MRHRRPHSIHEQRARLLLGRRLQDTDMRVSITAGKLGGTGCAAAVRALALHAIRLSAFNMNHYLL
jgi:hypothetical protein